MTPILVRWAETHRDTFHAQALQMRLPGCLGQGYPIFASVILAILPWNRQGLRTGKHSALLWIDHFAQCCMQFRWGQEPTRRLG